MLTLGGYEPKNTDKYLSNLRWTCHKVLSNSYLYHFEPCILSHYHTQEVMLAKSVRAQDLRLYGARWDSAIIL